MDKTTAPGSVRKALVAIATTAGATFTTLMLTAAPAAAAERIVVNHNENGVADQT